MASHLVARPPTCLACVRRIASAASSSSAMPTTGTAAMSLTQVRGKKTSGRLRSQGVVIRLLKDVPSFGKQGSIFRTDAGRMRNHFYPARKAEYVTRARLAELGLTKNDIGERDFAFRPEVEEVEEVEIDDAVEAIAFGNLLSPAEEARAKAKAQVEAAAQQALETDRLVPSHALDLMNTLIPETVIFERRLVHSSPQGKQSASSAAAPSTQEPSSGEHTKKENQESHKKSSPSLTPLQAHRAKLQAEADKARQAKQAAAERAAADKARREEEERAAQMTPEELERQRAQQEREAEERLKIHGSVTAVNVASEVKAMMLLDPEASRIHVLADGVSFVDLPGGADKIEKVGSFEVEIQALVGKIKVPSIRRTVKVVPV